MMDDVVGQDENILCSNGTKTGSADVFSASRQELDIRQDALTPADSTLNTKHEFLLHP